MKEVPAASQSDRPEGPEPAVQFDHAAVAMVLDDLKQLWLSGKSLFEVLDVIYETMFPLIPFDRLSVAFYEDETGLVVSRWVRSEAPVRSVDTGYSAELKGSSLEPILRTGRPRIINDLLSYLDEHRESRATRDIVRDGVRSNLTCPLRAGGRPIGLLFFSSHRPDAYRRVHVETFEAVAESLSLAVEKVKYIDDISRARNNYAEILFFVAHELKAPLANVVTLGQTLVGGYLGELAPDQKAKIQRMIDNCAYLITLVRDYLDLSQVETGEMRYNPAPAVDLAGEVVRPVAAMLADATRERGMDITLDLEYLSASCDPGLLRIVMTNLVGNAIKYGRSDSVVQVRLVRRAFTDYDDTGAARRDYWALFSVRNRGVGFTPDQKKRLFARFQRIHRPEFKTIKGSGIGLYVSRQIVVRHGGEITAESEPGEWAEFRFRIPLHQEWPAPDTETAVPRQQFPAESHPPDLPDSGRQR